MSKALILLSGGQDSTTCLFLAKRDGHELYTISFDYGQRNKRELIHIEKIQRLAGVIQGKLINVCGLLVSSSPLVQHDKQLKIASEKTVRSEKIEDTFVPLRNQLFLTIAMNHAYHHKIKYIYTGVSQVDYGGYPDCRGVFIQAVQDAGNYAVGHNAFRIVTPLLGANKKQECLLAKDWPELYYALSYTITSYSGLVLANDNAAYLRARGFEEAGIPDPAVLRAYCIGDIPALPGSDNYKHIEIYIKILKEQFDLDKTNTLFNPYILR